MFVKDDLVIAAIVVGAAVPATVGVAVDVDGLQLISAIGGGFVGALITARAAFDKSNPTPAGLTALNCMISLTTGSLSGMMLPHFVFSLLGMQPQASIEVVRGLALLLGFSGERVVALLLERFMAKKG